MFENNLIDNQTVSVLDKYINYHTIGKITMHLMSEDTSTSVHSDEDDVIIEPFHPESDIEHTAVANMIVVVLKVTEI